MFIQVDYTVNIPVNFGQNSNIVYKIKRRNKIMKKFVWFYDRGVNQLLEETDSLLPAISIACAPKCNMHCPHCIYDTGTKADNGLNVGEKIAILHDAHKLGAEFLQICHEGEPFMDDGVLPLIKETIKLGMQTFMYTNATSITPAIAKELYTNNVCLGVKCDSLNPDIFNKMLGVKAAGKVYQGIDNLLRAGYNQPFKKNGKLYTRMGLVCTLTSINAKIEDVKEVARFAWRNKIFFGAARLEKGGRATGKIWNTFKIPDKEKVIDFINWCSEQTGVDYWNAQPMPYCIGVCGAQVFNNGDVLLTPYGGSCDFTEPDGESYPEGMFTIGNLRKESLKSVVDKIWAFRKKIMQNGTLDKKLAEYEATKDIYPNGLQDCGSAKTYTLFVPFYHYLKRIMGN